MGERKAADGERTAAADGEDFFPGERIRLIVLNMVK